MKTHLANGFTNTVRMSYAGVKSFAVVFLMAAGLSTTVHLRAQDSLTQIYSKFDFVPGEKIIFFDDFSGEAIGDFPLLWNTNGSGEIVTIPKYPGRWLKITNPRGVTSLLNPLTLPENYTIEFDIIPQKDNPPNGSQAYRFGIISTTKPKNLLYGLARPGEAGILFEFAYTNSFFSYYNDKTPGLEGRTPTGRQTLDTKYHISVWVQKERIRLYQDEVKLFDVAKAMLNSYTFNMIRFQNGTPLIANMRIATGAPDLRSKLLTEGKLVSYGIYFDVNSDKLKPQSAGTLKEIATVMTENPTLRVRVVGHTDSDGDDASNLSLSKRRGAAVVSALTSSYGIAADRLESDGKGESEPIAENNTSVNKALNRRVEFLRLK